MNLFQDEIELHVAAIKGCMSLCNTLKSKGFNADECVKYEIGEKKSPVTVIAVRSDKVEDISTLLDTLDEMKEFGFVPADTRTGRMHHPKSLGFEEGYNYVVLSGTDPHTRTPISIYFGKNMPGLPLLIRRKTTGVEYMHHLLENPRTELLRNEIDSPYRLN